MEGSHWTNGLMVHDVFHPLPARDHPAVRACCLASIPLEELTSSNDFELGLRKRLAVLQSD